MFGLGLPLSLPSSEVSHSGVGTKMSSGVYPWRMVDQWLGFTSRCGYELNRMFAERDHKEDLLRSGSGRVLAGTNPGFVLSAAGSRSGPYGGFMVSMHGGGFRGGTIE